MFGFIPAKFKLERGELIPILRITGISPISDEMVERTLLSKTLEFVERAEKDGGKLMEITGDEDMSDLKEEALAIRAYLVFESIDIRDKAVSNIQRELG